MSRKSTLAEIAALPFIRPGAENFDMAYAVSIWDVRQRADLQRRIEAEPGKKHDSMDGLLHYVPNEAG